MAAVECGKGWEAIVNPLIAMCKANNVEIAQIKEKFGGLRFYVHGAPDWVEGLINTAEIASYHICEGCGKEGKLRKGSWLRTLCDEHAGETPNA